MSDCITVNGRNIAEITKVQTGLRSLLRHYELSFNFALKGSSDNTARWATVNSARVFVKKDMSGREYDIGFAQLEVPLSVKTHSERAINENFTFYLSLSPVQLSKLEEIRDGGDLIFSLRVKGQGSDNEYTNYIHDEWRVEMPRSKWIELLKRSDYMDVMLLEVPMLPKGEVSDEWIDVKLALQAAQEDFVNRKYANCISQCRKLIEDVGFLKFGESNWPNPLLDLIGKNKRSTPKGDRVRESMTKIERENAIWASLLHYTHLAHHGKSKGGESCYSRNEAKLILTLTAAFISS